MRLLPLIKELSAPVSGSMQAPPGRTSTLSMSSRCCSTSSSAEVSDRFADPPSLLSTSAFLLLAAWRYVKVKHLLDRVDKNTDLQDHTCLHYVFVFDFHLLPTSFVAAVRHPGSEKEKKIIKVMWNEYIHLQVLHYFHFELLSMSYESQSVAP